MGLAHDNLLAVDDVEAGGQALSVVAHLDAGQRVGAALLCSARGDGVDGVGIGRIGVAGVGEVR